MHEIFSRKFDDNCYELSVLRWFRDNFVTKEDIEHYYEVAPIIVEIINKVLKKTTNERIKNEEWKDIQQIYNTKNMVKKYKEKYGE